MIRPTQSRDVPAIMAIYDAARQFMKEQGNPTQWPASYPSRTIVEEDIARGTSYVVEQEGCIVGTFAFIIGEDPAYQVIEDGSWHFSEPYGTIHRIASSGQAKGLARQCFDFCLQQMPYLRIDTHADNQAMQAAVLRYGFAPCGRIYLADGSPRLAYDYHQ
ncbi:GNAT family N-acetyltransferase [Streptococcus panodentis]|uniref:N-acetyltransferase n=1 Tax=Streptococcus panodentis TaxID=1581472 RepID=A0ABS5AUP5_9STRE|nr:MULTISPECIES: GNAT family protein [Streptococcus]KXT84954.1 hypothetical protein STRDD11_00625 [Streptococcus sp. DD11]MBP2620289.1 N-acetyltransferase [Streptococcus panodentis]